MSGKKEFPIVKPLPQFVSMITGLPGLHLNQHGQIIGVSYCILEDTPYGFRVCGLTPDGQALYDKERGV